MSEEFKDARTVLTEAIRKRDDLNTTIKVLEEMLGGTAPTTEGNAVSDPAAASASDDVVDPLSVVYPGMFFGKTRPQAAKLLLDKVKRPVKAGAIIKCFEKGGLSGGGKKPSINLWGTLRRKKDIFILVPKAGWALRDWYDAATLARMTKGGKEENGNDEAEPSAE